MRDSPPSPFLSRFWPMFALALAAIGVPAAVLATFTRFIAEHPWLALGIWMLYEVAIFLLSFVGKVYQKLESKWVDSAASKFDYWSQSILSRYHKHYYDYLRYQHRDFDVKGLSTLGTYNLELDQVFVELSIDPTTIQHTSSNPIQIPQALREGSHSIWDYLASVSLKNQHLVIIGPPGSGKTTLLKHITLTQTTRRQTTRQKHSDNLPKVPSKLSILLFLRDHVEAFKPRSEFSLVDAVHDHLKKWEQPLPPVGWVRQQLIRGHCLIMLDGLDEVADPQMRHLVAHWVERQMSAYRQNRFIITSRPFGYRSNPLSGVAVLEVRPFTAEQVEHFVNKWYLANEIMSKRKDDPGVRMRARSEARELLQRLRDSPALFALTVNPLLLTMITTVHRYGGELPGKRVALYDEICEVFLGKRQQARGHALELTPDQIQLVLQPLAYHLMCTGIRDIALAEIRTAIQEPLRQVSAQMTYDAFLRLVENASGLLLERENGVYTFAHLTFQEYLAASHIQEKQMEEALVAQVGNPWWHETIRLYCAMADATPIIAGCLVGEHPSAHALALAFDCEREARMVQPTVRAQLEAILTQGIEDSDLERQHILAEALLARRLQKMIGLGDETYVDTSLVSCAEYQVFLDEQRVQGKYYQPDHWNGYRLRPNQGRMPLLGIRPSDTIAFCTWLTERESGLWYYRPPQVEELEKLRARGLLDRLPRDTGFWLDKRNEFVWTQGTSLLSEAILQEVISRDLANDQILADYRVQILRIARDLEKNLTSAHNPYLKPILKQTSDLIALLFNIFDHDLVHDLDRAHAMSINLVSDLNRTPVTAQDRDLALNLSSYLAHAYTHVSDLRHALDHATEEAQGHTLICNLDSVTHNYILDAALPRNRIYGIKLAAARLSIFTDSDRSTHDKHLDDYITLIVLEERINERLSPCEGILLVKERRKEIL